MSTEDAKTTTMAVDANIKAIKDSFYNGENFNWNYNGEDYDIGAYRRNAGGSKGGDNALKDLWNTYLQSINVDKNDRAYKLD
jgi:hypothetical protein